MADAGALLQALGREDVRVFHTDAGVDLDLGGLYVQVRDGVLLVDGLAVDADIVRGMLAAGVHAYIPLGDPEVPAEPEPLPPVADVPSVGGAAVDTPAPLPEVPVAVALLAAHQRAGGDPQ